MRSIIQTVLRYYVYAHARASSSYAPCQRPRTRVGVTRDVLQYVAVRASSTTINTSVTSAAMCTCTYMCAHNEIHRYDWGIQFIYVGQRHQRLNSPSRVGWEIGNIMLSVKLGRMCSCTGAFRVFQLQYHHTENK